MMDQLPQPESLILVGFIPSPRDLEVARVLGWYRIPLRTAPKVISVDYLDQYITLICCQLIALGYVCLLTSLTQTIVLAYISVFS